MHIGVEITRCWGVTLTSNEGKGTVTTRARWRVVSIDGSVVLAPRVQSEGKGEGARG
jgi:hypothetical protein